MARWLPSWVSYKGMVLSDIRPIPELCSRFLIHLVLENTFEFMDVRDRILID